LILLQDDSIKKMDSYAMEQLQHWCDLMLARLPYASDFLKLFFRSLAKESINRWSAYKLQLLGDIRRECRAKHAN
jgi:hypothetical protein